MTQEPLLTEFIAFYSQRRRSDGWHFWDFGNQILYDMCAQWPRHDRADIVAAKAWLIGRSYAAALERKAVNAEDNFYEQRVGNGLTNKNGREIDRIMTSIIGTDVKNTSLAVKAHYRVLEFVSAVTGNRNRSFVSKYLHFHAPKHFYIYDSRACGVVRSIAPRLQRGIQPGGDAEYSSFVTKCHQIAQYIGNQTGTWPTPRDLDTAFLLWHQAELQATRV